MKKILLLTITIFAATHLLHAQSGFYVGDRGFIGHSWTVGNRTGDDKYKAHASYSIGRTGIYKINESFGLGFGTYFSSEGVTFKNNTSDASWNLRTNYIRVPVFTDFNFGDPSSRVRPHLALGGSVGFLVGGRSLGLNDNDVYVGGVKATKGMKTKIDAGLNGSLGFTVKLTDGVLVNHDINYYHGLVKQEAETVMGGDVFTNRNIGLSMNMLISGQAMRNWKNKMMNKEHRWRH